MTEFAALAAVLGMPTWALALAMSALASALLAAAVWLFGKDRVAAWLGPRLSSLFPPRAPPQ
jgi:hypothetical protein